MSNFLNSQQNSRKKSAKGSMQRSIESQTQEESRIQESIVRVFKKSQESRNISQENESLFECSCSVV